MKNDERVVEMERRRRQRRGGGSLEPEEGEAGSRKSYDEGTRLERYRWVDGA